MDDSKSKASSSDGFYTDESEEMDFVLMINGQELEMIN